MTRPRRGTSASKGSCVYILIFGRRRLFDDLANDAADALRQRNARGREDADRSPYNEPQVRHAISGESTGNRQSV